MSRINVDTRVKESAAYIREKINGFRPSTGIILGTGLGELVKEVAVKYDIDYGDIPHFPLSTVEFHHGRLIFGEIASHPLVIMKGRFHFYEGYSLYQVTYPIRIMQQLGVRRLLVSNACGAVNPLYDKGDIMIMREHINFLFDSPLIPGAREPVSDGFSNSTATKEYATFPRGVFNRKIYSKELIKLAESVAVENGLKLQKGVYLTLPGPHLETRSEYRMVRKLGADVVGMSTAPEALLSNYFGFDVLGFSIVTDVGFPDSLKPIDIQEILAVAAVAEPKLTLLIKKIIEKNLTDIRKM
jgi:purine-nucleoside phosphorylase